MARRAKKETPPAPTSNGSSDGNHPAFKAKLGPVESAVFRNVTQAGTPYYATVLQRSLRDKDGQWINDNKIKLFEADLAHSIQVLDESIRFLVSLQQDVRGRVQQVTNHPTFKAKLGPVEAAVFQNVSQQNGSPYLSTVLSRSLKDKDGEWNNDNRIKLFEADLASTMSVLHITAEAIRSAQGVIAKRLQVRQDSRAPTSASPNGEEGQSMDDDMPF